jgi:transposase InsO family protein
MSLKLEFVEAAMRPGRRMAPLCRQYGISRETGYKWLNRFRRQGPAGLEERSRRPKSVPLATAEDLVFSILEARERKPRWGPKKLFVVLEREYGAVTPSVATIARVLRRFGLIRQRSRFRRLSVVESAPKARATTCNEIWTVDFKGWWRARDGQRCEPLTVRDAFSRFVLAVRVFKTPSVEGVRSIFEQLFRRYGLPAAIQCDNGAPFISVQARGGLTRLSAWWVSLGIKVLRSRPGCPQDNGGHERMHRDIADDLQSLPAGSMAEEQRACDRWRLEFNNVRPHEALAGQTPGEVYKASPRRPRALKYLYPSGWLVRTVTDKGHINIRSNQITGGRAIVRQQVGLEPLGGLKYRMWFRDVDLGIVELELENWSIDAIAQQHIASRTQKERKAA